MAEKFWKLGIIGWPLGYSLSPLMHTAALKAAGLRGEYREYPVRPEELNHWLETEAPRLDGFNVTLPHKGAVYSWLKQHQGESGAGAVHSAAVNTVKVKGGRLSGYNTDGIGFLKPMRNPPRSLSLAGWHVVLLGAGGSAEAITDALLSETKITKLVIWNRHLERAEELAKRFNSIRSGLCSATDDFKVLPMEGSQLLINATPMGMKGDGNVPAELLKRVHHGQLVYDIVYEPRETALIRAAREKGCPVITGEEMLAGQGAAAFEIWTGVPAAQVLPVMKKELDEHFVAAH